MLGARPQIALWRCGRGWRAPSIRGSAGVSSRGIDALGSYDGTIPDNILNTRIDVWVSKQLPHASRGRVQDSIRKGFARVNGKTITKPSFPVEGGDHVMCTLCDAAALEAKPESIHLDVVYEDDYVIVINKSADMVVHPAPGHSSGTLVNAILHHCGLPAVTVTLPVKANEELDEEIVSDESDDDQGEELAGSEGEEDNDEEEEDDEEEDEDEDEEKKDEEIVIKARGEAPAMFRGPKPVIRPGIVHRLDKGTTGLLVVAKNDLSQLSLSKQFKSRKVRRSYLSLTCGAPSMASGRVEAAIVRDPRDRKRMTTADSVPFMKNARSAASRYKVIDVVANGGAALVQWKLETGRTHQIRVHARYIGFPILGDEVYGGTAGTARSRLCSSLNAISGITRKKVYEFVSDVRRPCLHAYSLGFKHPATKKRVHFTCPPPRDFEELWTRLRNMEPEI